MRIEFAIKQLIMANKIDEAKSLVRGAWIAIKHDLTINDLLSALTETSVELIPTSLLRIMVEERLHEKDED